MLYRMKPGVPLLIVKDETGQLHHHYNQSIGGSIGFGLVIDYLNDEQKTHFLRMGLVEEVVDEAEGPAPVVVQWPSRAEADPSDETPVWVAG
jgi:hypothetical protein